MNISDLLIKDSYDYVLQVDKTTGIVYRIGGDIPLNPIFSSGLTVNGAFVMKNGTEAAGKMLISDENGVGTWVPAFGTSGTSGANGAGGALGYYGSFFDDTTQISNGGNVVNTMSFSQTYEAHGINIDTVGGLSSRITIDNPGTYNIQFTARFVYTGLAPTVVNIWLSKNGVTVPNTNSDFTLEEDLSGGGGRVVSSWNFIVTTTAINDYLELNWLASDGDVTIEAIAESIPLGLPATPSTSLTVQQIMYTQSGTSGRSGTGGTSATSGRSGTSATSGRSGTSATSGISGTNGTSGADGNIIGVTYFLSGASTDLGGYEALIRTPIGTAQHDDSASCIGDGSGGYGTEVFIGQYVTTLADPNVSYIPAGEWNFNFWSYVDMPPFGNSRLVYKVYIRDLSGTETLLFTKTSSSIGSISSTSPTFLNDIYNINIATLVNSTDRIILKIYCQSNGNTSNTVHYLHLGLDYYSHFHTPITQGLPGAAGTSGTSATAGTSGTGTSGTSGTTGTSATAGSSGANGTSGTNAPGSYLETAFVAATGVTVTHNFGARPNVMVTLTSGSDEVVFTPYSIIHKSLNQFIVTFSTARTGHIQTTIGSPSLSAYVLASGSYSASSNDYFIKATGSGSTITLPTAGFAGKIIVVKNMSGGNITVNTISSQTIDGSLSTLVANTNKLEVFADGANWLIK